MMTPLENKDVLSRLGSSQTVLEFLLGMGADDLTSFTSMLGWQQSLLMRLRDEQDRLSDLLEFITKLKPDELRSFSTMLSWRRSLLERLRDEPHHLGVLHKMWDIVDDRDQFTKTYLSMEDRASSTSINLRDAFSQGQIDSKLWLVDTVSTLGLDLGKVWMLCGWVGMLAYLMFSKGNGLRFETIRSFDVDPPCATLAEMLNRPQVKDGWRFKATTMDVNDLIYDGMTYDTERYDGTKQRLTESADTVINTSCDHMGGDDTWFDRIPHGRLVVLQNNDWFGNEQHDNSVGTLAEFSARYPMHETLYSGTLDCKLYRRFMLIGRK